MAFKLFLLLTSCIARRSSGGSSRRRGYSSCGVEALHGQASLTNINPLFVTITNVQLLGTEKYENRMIGRNCSGIIRTNCRRRSMLR
jgi:hypothetical protein